MQLIKISSDWGSIALKMLAEAQANTIPVKLKDKSPLCKSWTQYQNTPQTTDDIIDIFRANNIEGIALITGKYQKDGTGFYCVDFDNKLKDEDITPFFEEFRQTFNKVCYYSQRTQSGGFHVIIKCREITGNEKFAMDKVGTKPNGKDDVVAFLESRGQGGYCLISPTAGYQQNSTYGIEHLTITEPEVVEEIKSWCRSKNRYFKAGSGFSHTEKDHPTSKKKYNYEEINTSKEVFEECKQVLSINGWTFIRERFGGDSLGQCSDYYRAGKTKGSVTGGFTHNNTCFYMFSSNGFPFEERKGYFYFDIIKMLKFDGDWKKTALYFKSKGFSVFPEGETGEDIPFYNYNWDEEKETGKLSVNSYQYIAFLEQNGFAKMFRDETCFFIKCIDNIIEETTIDKIQNFTLNYIKNMPIIINEEHGITNIDLLNIFINRSTFYFKESFLKSLKEIEPNFKRDTKDKAFLFYLNGWVTVDTSISNEFLLRPYSELDGIIWKSSIINREYYFKFPTPQNFFYLDFLVKATNTTEENLEKLESLMSGMGYLMHRFKDESATKAVIFCDEANPDSTDVNDCQGRSGKSLVAEKSLERMRNLVKEDGRNFRFDKSFAFQNVNLDTQVYLFDDTQMSFQFNKLFSMITGSMIIEKKGKQPIVIPFSDAPKIVITTNYTIDDETDSAKARKHEIEFSNFFNKNNTPIKYYGRAFFNDFTPDEWFMFDTLMLSCIKTYLCSGFITYEAHNLERKKFVQSCRSDALLNYLESEEVKNCYVKMFALEHLEKFLLVSGEPAKMWSVNRFGRTLKDYAKMKGLEFVSEQEHKGDRRGQKTYRLLSPQQYLKHLNKELVDINQQEDIF
jgi:hypothetical protein